MYLPELTGVKFLGQFLNTLLDERLPLFCDDQGVLILGLELVRLLHGYETDIIFNLSYQVGVQIRAVLTLFLPCFVCAFVILEFIKLLDDVLDVFLARVLPNA